MKTISLLLALVCAFGGTGSVLAQANNSGDPAGPPKVGVYDSRALAFAYFWSDAGKKERNALMSAAKEAEASGDTRRFNELKAQISEMQKRDHLQVFSSAPAEQALAALKDKLPALQAELGVRRFVSKWDDRALRRVPETSRVDVTDRLTRELFTPTARQLKTLEALKSSRPLPLDEARQMAAAGKL